MNEGHSALLALELLQEQLATSPPPPIRTAAAAVAKCCVFTTHTPVPAGHDVFAFGLVEKYLAAYWPTLGLDRDRFLALGADHEPRGTAFNMTALALRLSGHRNAVSRRHGEVSRRMWRPLWPDASSEDAVPIATVTNGVHVPSWVATEMDALFRRYLGEDWVARHDDPALWAGVTELPDRALWEVRRGLTRTLLDLIRERARARWAEDRIDPGQVTAAGVLLDPDALTIGFARRFATYRRATLILRDLPRLRAILTHPRRPVQLVFAGKAHPADEGGKQLLQTVYRAARDPELGGRLAFLEDYDMHAARYLVQGVDLWLNTPTPPMEASGTSGQKAALNGVPNLSVLDGWWAEAYDGTNGWAIGEPAGAPLDEAARDAADAEALYRVLEREVVPLYYDRGPDGLPGGWLRVVRRAIETSGAAFSARRMVKEYVGTFYTDAATAAEGDR
ncbi:MAG TPA: alpha-glucan family phosphorylase, partial [Methylomirabilota bacterium]|nr:alpha-glucan family phosphorylase [Methylomirabilota bacterium]